MSRAMVPAIILASRERRRLQRKVRKAQRQLAATEKKIKKKLLAGALVEQGRFAAELELLPGRDSASKNPDDYKLIVHDVQ